MGLGPPDAAAPRRQGAAGTLAAGSCGVNAPWRRRTASPSMNSYTVVGGPTNGLLPSRSLGRTSSRGRTASSIDGAQRVLFKSVTVTNAQGEQIKVAVEGDCVRMTLPGKPELAYNSVLTTIRILEKKGYIKHVKDGRAHVYVPVVARQDASRSEIRHLVSRFFKNV